MSTFLQKFINTEEGFFSITTLGTYGLVVLFILSLLVAAYIVDRKQKSARFSTKQLVFSGTALALGFLTSYIKFKMPFGGSVTLFSMLFICLIGYWYGVKVGMFTAFAYSILQFLQSGSTYFLTPFQTCCDYFFAFTALGLAGLFYKKKNGLVIGYIISVFVRGLFHTIGGYIFWLDYMPSNFPKSVAFAYPFIYNYSYLIAEIIITMILIQLPPVKKALERMKTMATSQ